MLYFAKFTFEGRLLYGATRMVHTEGITWLDFQKRLSKETFSVWRSLITDAVFFWWSWINWYHLGFSPASLVPEENLYRKWHSLSVGRCIFCHSVSSVSVPSVLWRCWLGGRKSIWPVKDSKWWGAGVVCLEWGADLHMVQLIPRPLTVACFSKIQIGYTFLVPSHPGSPDKGLLNRCVPVISVKALKEA